MAKSSRRISRPSKPRADLPLFPHRNGLWARKIRGKFCYFGKWADDGKGEAALQKHVDQRDDLYAGRKPQSKREGLTVEDACNKFLHAKKARVESGEIAESTWKDYRIVAKRVARVLGNPGIVRNRLKIHAAIENVRAFLVVQQDFGSFDKYIWDFVGSRPRQNAWKSLRDVPARTPESDAMSADMKRRGFKFVGSTICYAFMQAVGMVNDHLVGCFRHGELEKAAGKRRGKAGG